MAKKAPASPPRATTLRNVCVYCGSGPGDDPAFIASARRFGEDLAKSGIGLVYGGGGRGLMGAVARAALDHGGRVTGIIPNFLVGPEHAIPDLTERVVTASMHERKHQMFLRADAFVALPGGIGTVEEFVEQLTWNQIGQHVKPLILANVSGYWSPLVTLIEHLTRHAFIRPSLEVAYDVCDRVEDILPLIRKRLDNPHPVNAFSAALNISHEKL